VSLTRLQSSLYATARTLAPSVIEALDTPLSPPRLHDEPGPATRRSGAYRDGTSTREPDPTCRTQHQRSLRPRISAQISPTPTPKQQASRLQPRPNPQREPSQVGGTHYTRNQASYDLARLRINGLITRIPDKNRYRLTADGLRFAGSSGFRVH
jgi:hypothetical protein